MGWSSASIIFDRIASEVLNKKPINKKRLLKSLIDELEDGDWDTQRDSKFWKHPLVQEIMKEKHPDWFKK